jgi:hypothetical protein
MNVSMDLLDNGMEAKNTQCISAANRKCAHNKIEGDSNGEPFDFQEVDTMLNPPDEERKAVSDNNIVCGSLKNYFQTKNLQNLQKDCYIGSFKTWRRQYVVRTTM